MKKTTKKKAGISWDVMEEVLQEAEGAYRRAYGLVAPGGGERDYSAASIVHKIIPFPTLNNSSH